MPNGIWLKTGHDWLGRIKECLLHCGVGWGNILVLVAHNCVDRTIVQWNFERSLSLLHITTPRLHPMNMMH